ncbi:hypothetical protein K7X08_036961 [Anisodus acutangulus]|uniref:TF-B3 domain-containing protein n=1 Tax=Anisodus acutangulus TaxID=402998 RepID=A0A9Q1QWT2_9SOLA|nr:hypothetical protein K7X08_036961 [Anisodus acutangulus]
MWPIRVAKTGRVFYFEYGWEKFIEDNTLEIGDFLVFDYDGNVVFDFKLFGKNGCEKKGAGGLKLDVKEHEEEEMIVEHQKREDPKGKWPSDSNNSSSDDSDEDDEDYMVEEEEEETEVEEEHERETIMCKENEPRSKGRRLKKKRDDDEEIEEEETENARHSKHRQVEEEEEEENERVGILKKKASRPKAGGKKVTTRKVGDFHDYSGKDIFESGRATKPKNPHFVTKIRSKRSDQLYVPCDVVRNYKLELPPSMTIRDSTGRKLETKCKKWKDGRIWLVGGWRNLCKWNLVGKDDNCICEFVKGEGNEGLYLQVQVLYEGAGSHPNKK